jgi:hypothetical protein
MIEICDACSEGPHGEVGHRDMAFLMHGPYPEHETHLCLECGETWVRYPRCFGRTGWIRYAFQFPLRHEAVVMDPLRYRPRRPAPGSGPRPVRS